MSFIERLRYAFKILIGREIDCVPFVARTDLDKISSHRRFRIDTRRDPSGTTKAGVLPMGSDLFRNELEYSRKFLLREIEHLISIKEIEGYFYPHREFEVSIEFYKEKPQQGGQRAI
jgi:hypothetical protein